jgi:hypothetical protein
MKCPKDDSHELTSQIKSDTLHAELMICPIHLDEYIVVYPPSDVGVIHCSPENDLFLITPVVAAASLSFVDLT